MSYSKFKLNSKGTPHFSIAETSNRKSTSQVFLVKCTKFLVDAKGSSLKEDEDNYDIE